MVKPKKISLLMHFINTMSTFFTAITYEVFLQVITYIFGIIGAVMVCFSPNFPNPMSYLTEKFKQYAIRRSFMRKVFRSYLRDVKLKASVELKAHDKQR